MAWLVGFPQFSQDALIALFVFIVTWRWLAGRRVLPSSETPSVVDKLDKYYLAYRIQGVPVDWDEHRLRLYLQDHLSAFSPTVKSLALEVGGSSQTATATLVGEYPGELLLPSVKETTIPHWLILDHHFRGITTLYAPPPKDHQVDLIVVHGLGGHPYGSFKKRKGDYMWLLDSLPNDLKDPSTKRPMARIILYGQDSSLVGSTSMQNLEDLSLSFRDSLLSLSIASSVKPIIFLGHSLGGLIVKQALISIIRSEQDDDAYRKLAGAIRGIVFFGVPHDGMEIKALRVLLKDNLNRSLVESLCNKNSSVLSNLRRGFNATLDRLHDAEIFSFYETEESATPSQDAQGNWEMKGPKVVLVTQPSATHCFASEYSNSQVCGISRSHSEMVKFGRGDEEYAKVRNRLQLLAHRAVSAKSTTHNTAPLHNSTRNINQTTNYHRQETVSGRGLHNNIQYIIYKNHGEELHRAVLYGNESEVRKLIRDGVDIEALNSDRRTPLLESVLQKNSSMIKLLLTNGADINACDKNRSTPSHDAVKLRDIYILQTLLQHNPDLTIQDIWGHSIFHLAAISSTEVLKTIVTLLPEQERKRNMEDRTGDYASSGGGETPLHLTTLRGEERKFNVAAFEEGASNAKLLLEYGANVNARTSRQGRTTLHKAAKSANLPLVKVLLKFGADQSITDNDGNTATSQEGIDEATMRLIDTW